MTEQRENTVVVGVDGSECGAAAVRWAESYAEKTGASLTLVTAWHWPTSYGVPIPLDDFHPEEDAQKLAAAAAADLRLPPEQVRIVVEQGFSGDVLCRTSAGAAALVVGTRGHGALAGVVIGSTSGYCVHHAQCPVVVVR